MALELVGNMALALMVVAPKRVEASVWSVSFRHTGKLKTETAKMTTPCPTCGMKCKAQIYYNDDVVGFLIPKLWRLTMGEGKLDE